MPQVTEIFALLLAKRSLEIEVEVMERGGRGGQEGKRWRGGGGKTAKLRNGMVFSGQAGAKYHASLSLRNSRGERALE